MLSVCFCLAVFTTIAVAGETLQWKETLRRALDLQTHQQRAEAETVLTGLLAQAERQNPADPRIAVALNSLGSVYHDEGRYLDARSAYLRSIGQMERTLGPDEPYLLKTILNLAALYLDTGELSKAKALLDRGLRLAEQNPSVDRGEHAGLLNSLATVEAHRGHADQAESLLRKALQLSEGGHDPVLVGSVLNNLAVLCQPRDPALARSYSRRAVELMESHAEQAPTELARSLVNLGVLEDQTGERQPAEEHLKRALSFAEATFGPQHPLVGSVLSTYGAILHRQGRRHEAKRMRKRAEAILAHSRQQNIIGLTVDANSLVAGR